MVHKENPKEPNKQINFLELMRVKQGHRIQNQCTQINQLLFYILATGRWEKTLNIILIFTIVQKMKYLSIKLIKHIEDLYAEY